MISFLPNEYDSRGVVKPHGLRGLYTAPESGTYIVLGDEVDLMKGESILLTLSDEEVSTWLNKAMVKKKVLE